MASDESSACTSWDGLLLLRPRGHYSAFRDAGALAVSKLTSRSLGALLWGTGGAVTRMALQVGSQIVLARVLGPEQFGIFATAAIVVAFSSFLSDVGLAYGLIQKEHIDAQDIRFVLAWQWTLGLVIALGLALGSGVIASFFGEPRTQPIVALMGLVCLFNALAAPSLNLLKRDLDFRRVQIAGVASYFVGFFLVGIPLALAGAQVWALAIAWLVQSAVMLALLYAAVRHPLAVSIWYPQAGVQWRYAGTVLATNIVNWIVANVDRVVVARMFGSLEVGLYSTAYNLMYAPGAALAGVIQPVIFSASARIANEHERLADAFRSAVAVVVALVVPAFALFALVSAPLVNVLFGHQWQSAASLAVPLALAMPMVVLVAVSTPVLWTRGSISSELRLQLPMILIALCVCVVAARSSLHLVAWAVLTIYMLRAVLLVRAAAGACGIGLWPLVAGLRGPLVWATFVVACVGLVRWATEAAPAVLQLSACTLASVVAWFAAPLISPRIVSADSRRAYAIVLVRLPARMRLRLSYLGTGGNPND